MWKLLLLSCVLALSSSSKAQDENEKEWARHMKAGAKEYQEGLLKKYYQLNRAGAAVEFAKAERDLLAALTQTQQFPSGDEGTAVTLGMLADTYMQEGKLTEAESRGNEAIAIMEKNLAPDNPRLGNDLIHMALIYDAESKSDQAAPLWDRALTIFKKAPKAPDPQLLSTLQIQAAPGEAPLGTKTSEHIYRFLLEIKEAKGASDEELVPVL